jgi:HK97 family phage portal protein
LIQSKGEVTSFGFAPQALGETVPNLANGYFYSRDGLNLAGMIARYSQLYKRQAAIATVVDKIANAAARLTVKVWDTTPATGRVEDTTSPFARLIADPCPIMAPMPFWRWTFSTYEIYGETFWYKLRAGKDAFGKPSGPVIGLLPMHPSRTAVHRNEDGDVEYVFTLGVASAGILVAPATDVVAFLRFNPENLMRGLSRLEPLNATLFNEDAARRANASWWQRGARPSVVLSHPGELSQGAMDRIKASFDARHAGADLMGGTSVLEEGMTATIIQLNAEEMQYIESRKLNREEVCMVYDVPPPVIHILDHATFSNITEQMRSMYRDTMSPRLEDVESVIDWSLRSEFFNAGERETEFDMASVLRGDFETRADKSVTLRNAGILTGNEGRELSGYARLDDPEMDKVYANAAIVELGTPAQRVSVTEAANPTPAVDAEATDAVAGARSDASDAQQSAGSDTAKAVTVRSVMGKTGRVKDSKSAIRATLIGEHEKALGSFFDEQRAAVKKSVAAKAAGHFDPTEWDPALASILHTLSQATAKAIGAKVAADLGGKYSSHDIEEWLESNAQASAKKINQATADEITKALEDAAPDDSDDDTVDDIFDGEVSARAKQISASRVALVAGLASLVAARQSGAKTKTWVSGPNPRSAHAEMDGETVALGEPFSNGMDGPGDYSGGADEVAGCNCDLDFSTEG